MDKVITLEDGRIPDEVFRREAELRAADHAREAIRKLPDGDVMFRGVSVNEFDEVELRKLLAYVIKEMNDDQERYFKSLTLGLK